MVASVAPLVCADCGARRAPQVMVRLPGGPTRCESCHRKALDAQYGPELEPEEPTAIRAVVNGAAPPVPTSLPRAAGVPAREELRRWARALVKGVQSTDMPALVREGVARFGGDAAFLHALATELLPDLVRGDLKRALRAERQDVAGIGRPRGRPTQWESFLEQAGARRLSVMDMTRAELEQAARWREDLAAGHLGYARLWRELAATLGDGERVRDRFTEAEIDALYAAITAGKGAA